MYLKSIALLAVLLLQVINEANSIKCYVCKGDLTSDCETNPNNEELLVDCTEDKIRAANASRGKPFNISNAISSRRASDSFSCVTLYETIKGEKKVERYCALKRWSCDELRKQAEEEEAGLQVDSCGRCGRDRCNAPVAQTPTTTTTLSPNTTGEAPTTTTTLSPNTTGEAPTTDETQSTLRCYQCSGDFDSECHRYPYQKKFENFCPDADASSSHFDKVVNASRHFHCIAYETLGAWRGVVRSCVPTSYDCKVVMIGEVSGSVTNCRTCDVDLCNAASPVQSSFFSLICFIFALAFLSKL